MPGICDYGRRYIRPSLSNGLGEALPRRTLAKAAKTEPEARMRSIGELKAVFSGSADWNDMFSAAGELGRMVGRLDDIEALGYVVRFCEDEDSRGRAMEKVSSRMQAVLDPRVLEAIVMHTDDEDARRKAIEVLGQRTDDVTSAFTLVHIAMGSKSKTARFSAVNKLRGKIDELRVVAEHSQYEDTKEYARSLMPAEA